MRGQSLLKAAQDNDINGLVAHTNKPTELEQIIAVHRQGIPIVAVTSMWRSRIDSYLEWDNVEKTLQTAGVPMIEKSGKSGLDIFMFLYSLMNN